MINPMRLWRNPGIPELREREIAKAELELHDAYLVQEEYNHTISMLEQRIERLKMLQKEQT